MTVADGPQAVDAAAVGRIFREESGRSVATLIRIFGDIDLAEDAVQEAFAVAIWRWPDEGLPPNPGAWITTTAKNRAIDRLRREARGRELIAEVAALDRSADDPPEEVGPVQDDRLRLLFTCCHPALSTEAQVALTLRLLGGLATEEVARAFLVAEPTMAKRLVRAKHKIKAARIPYRVPSDADLPDRLRAVLTVVYLVYNAGADWASGGELCAEAVRLARLLAELMPDEPEVAGLLALLLLTDSRRGARFGADGSLVLLADQDRSRWERALIDEGQAIVRACLRRDRPGPYQLQAAINAVHVDAAAFGDTDWEQMVLKLEDVDQPDIAPNEVLVRVRATSVNPKDWRILRADPQIVRPTIGLFRPRAGSILGGDVAGVVERAGADVTRFRPGDEVYGEVFLGAFAEAVAVRQDALATKPANLTFEQAAAVPLAAQTALQGLRDVGHVAAGQRVLINGAAGGIGSFAVQLAKTFDAEVTAVCSTRNVDLVRSLGADVVVDYTKEESRRAGSGSTCSSTSWATGPWRHSGAS